MRTNRFLPAGALIAAALAAGCLARPTRTDLAFGTAQRLAVIEQTADPEAETRGAGPVRGLEARAALGALSRRLGTFGYDLSRDAAAASSPVAPAAPTAAQPQEVLLRVPKLPAAAGAAAAP